MARVHNPLLSTQASGTFSGLTYGTNRGVAVVRRRPDRTRKTIVMLVSNASLFSRAVKGWRQITTAQKEQWQVWASNNPSIGKMGVKFGQNGYNAFFKLTMRKIVAGHAVTLGGPPVTEMLSTVTAFRVDPVVGSGSLKVLWTKSSSGAGEVYRWELQRTRYTGSSGRQSVKNRWRPMQNFAVSTVNYTYTALVQTGWYWIRVRLVRSDGLVSPWYELQAQANA